MSNPQNTKFPKGLIVERALSFYSGSLPLHGPFAKLTALHVWQIAQRSTEELSAKHSQWPRPLAFECPICDVMTDPKLFDFAATLKHETESALLVTDGIKDYWLPKKLTEDNGDGTFAIPEWLAVQFAFTTLRVQSQGSDTRWRTLTPLHLAFTPRVIIRTSRGD